MYTHNFNNPVEEYKARYKLLVQRYKKYDATQKEYIKTLLGNINSLQKELEDARLEIKELNDKLIAITKQDNSVFHINSLIAKINNQRTAIKALELKLKVSKTPKWMDTKSDKDLAEIAQKISTQKLPEEILKLKNECIRLKESNSKLVYEILQLKKQNNGEL